MNNNLKSLLACMMVIVMGMNLASCNGPDEIDPIDKLYNVQLSNISYSSITLSIDTVYLASRCEILCEETKVTKKLTLNTPKTVEFTDLAENTKYNFSIKYFNTSNVNVFTKSVVAKTTVMPSDIPTVQITLSEASVAYLKIKFKPSGTAVKFSCNKGSALSSYPTKYTTERTFTYSELKENHEYKFTAQGYDANGNAGPLIHASFSTIPCPYTNYIIYNSKVYPLSYVEMQAKHGYSGTNTGSNFKYLRFYGDDVLVQFYWANHEWEGIDKYWNSGTYTIQEDGLNSYYKYYCVAEINGHKDAGFEGKLTIKQSGNNMIFDFNLDNGLTLYGHYEGTVR